MAVSLLKSTTPAAVSFDVVGFIIGAEDGTVSPLEYLEGCAILAATGAVRGLQGSWQRAVDHLVRDGLIDPSTGSITDRAVDLLASLPESD